jgi:putative peptidoglycan lipid II flippase
MNSAGSAADQLVKSPAQRAANAARWLAGAAGTRSVLSPPARLSCFIDAPRRFYIAALVLVTVPPTRRLHLRLRPVLRFPPGVARRASGLALVGVIDLIAINVSSVVTIALANGHGRTGALVIFNYASQVFTAISAMLALSIVTSAFPVLSARDGPGFDRTSAGSAARPRCAG